MNRNLSIGNEGLKWVKSFQYWMTSQQINNNNNKKNNVSRVATDWTQV
jgi:hypothetical protein